MRILAIRFRNLNSLVGEWEIDLTHPAFGDGIFAIIGPTGAGKSTLLDAICLALYGRTPRLGRVNKNENEIMSRQTGECFAEVVFETRKGRYRCLWSQRRARANPRGELQAQKHEISDEATRGLVSSKLADVPRVVEQYTGMDFERFTRSMLLAQGDFAAFLLAPPDTRAPILEQITGTEIYSRISMRVFARRGEERRRLELLQAGLAGYAPLKPEEEASLDAALKQKIQADGEKLAELARRRETIAWRRGMQELEADLNTLAAREKSLTERRAAFAPRRERLDAALRALELAAEYSALSALRRAEKEDRESLRAGREAVPREEVAALAAEERLQGAAKTLASARAAQQERRMPIRRARELDQRAAEKQASLVALEKAVAEREQARLALQNQQERDRADLARRQKDLEALARWLEEHRIARSERLARLNEQQEGLERERGLLATQLSLLRNIADLSEARRHLEDGRPCPLCGATEHPYVGKDHPQPDETRRRLALVDAEWKALRAAILELAENTLQAKQAEKSALERNIATLAGTTAQRAEALEAAARDLAQSSEQGKILRKECQSLRAERRERFGDGNPDEEETRLAKAVEAAERAQEDGRIRRDEASASLARLKTKIAELEENGKRRAGPLLTAETAFAARLAAAAFADEAQYRGAALPEDERRRLEAEARRLAEEASEIAARTREKRQRLELEKRKAANAGMLEEALENLLAAESGLARQHDDLQQEIGALRQQLQDNETAKRELAARQAAIAGQQGEYRRWQALHELIGSENGKRYRNFAQGLTFERLIGEANLQLARMSGRYLLIRNEAEALELDVVDADQAGELRSTRNLSGGECFIVSLALALGLSRMAGRNVAVDSLFLDEGFGALDEDTLETALETLAHLEREGKLIGVISHVPALRERIRAQIRVVPQSGGRSRVEGPGVSGRG
ncbi:MAG: AAA family ATPase [Candidatus Accumulibacter sp.]|jgi:exonuclease SbcC|nr:AAA family ATPase [Accumulibacter sp.]